MWVAFITYRATARTFRFEYRNARLPASLSLLACSARISGRGNFVPPLAFILACYFRPNRYLNIPLLIDVENQGHVTATDVFLYLRYPRLLRQVPAEYEGDILPAINAGDDFETVRLSLGDIHPGGPARFIDGVSISHSIFPEKAHVTALSVDFRLTQRNAPAEEGTLRFAIIDCSRTDLQNGLEEASALLSLHNLHESSRIRDIFFRASDRLLDGLAIIGRCVALVRYDQNATVADPTFPVDRVPPTALLIKTGALDRRGKIWFAGINAKRAYVFHGRIHPEVPGLDKGKGVDPAVTRVTK